MGRLEGAQAGRDSPRLSVTCRDSSLGPWFDYTINGLVVGNIYALLAVGLALIYGVSHLINFAHGSIYMVGAYIGWLCITYLGTPLPVTLLAVVIGCGLLGMAIERVGLRPLQGSPRIAPLLSTIGIGLVLDQVVQLMFTPDPRGVPLQLPDGASRSAAAPSARSTFSSPASGSLSALALYLLPALHQARLGGAGDRARPRRRAAMRRRRQPREQRGVRDRGRARRRLGLSRRHVLQLDRSQHGLSCRPEGHRRADDRRHGQRAGRDRRQPAARPDRELRHRGVRHQLPQPVRLRGDDPHPGAEAERHLQPRARPAARAAHRHLHRAERADAHADVASSRRSR